MAEDKAENSKPLPSNYEKTLDKLAKLEEKLNVLRNFNEQSEQLRETRKKLLENLMNLNKDMVSESKMELAEKRVKFVDGHEDDEDGGRKLMKTISRIKSKNSVQLAQKSKSLHELLTNLQTWHGELHEKKSQIEMLKNKRQSIPVEDKVNEYDDKIEKLEKEKDELNDRILHFVIQNINEGKEEYLNLVTHLEDENREMEDRMALLHKQIAFLKDTNIALIRENERLRNPHQQSSSMSLQVLDFNYRKSMMAGKSSTFLPASILFDSMLNIEKTPSQQIIHDMEKEDELSLGKESLDSFGLDTQIATWKMDDKSIHHNVQRLGQHLQEMEIIQMKLNMIKRYVWKHGTKSINRNTLIDPTNGLGLW